MRRSERACPVRSALVLRRALCVTGRARELVARFLDVGAWKPFHAGAHPALTAWP
jgi:hypothetical protein